MNQTWRGERSGLELRIAAYLDGELGRRAENDVEVALIDPVASELLSRELMARVLSGSTESWDTPGGLGMGVAGAADVRPARPKRAKKKFGAAWRSKAATGTRGLAVGAVRVGVAVARLSAATTSTARASAASLRLATVPARLWAARSEPAPAWLRATAALWRILR